MALAAALVLLVGQPASAAVLRWAPATDNDRSKPVTIYGEHISTWSEGGHHVFRVAGKVWINQGVNSLRFEQGILWIDDNRQQREGVYDLQIYAEGNVSAESGLKNKRGSPQAHVALKTTGKVTFNASDKKILREKFQSDPLYQRAFQEFAAVRSGLPVVPTDGDPVPQIASATPTGKGLAAPGPLTALGDSAPVGGQMPASAAPATLNVPAAGFIRQVSARSPEPTGAAVQDQPVPVPAVPVPGAPAPPAPGQPNPPGAPGQKKEVLPVPQVVPGTVLGGPTMLGERPYIIRPRSTLLGIQFRTFPLQTGETAAVINSGVILTVANSDGKGGVLDIEADRLVFWTRGNPQQIIQDMQSPGNHENRPLELYMAGNVEIRRRSGKELVILRADEVYYDVNRHVAIASHADLEIVDPRMFNPVHVQSDELLQLNADLFRSHAASVNASQLPWDPGLQLTIQDATLENRPIIRRTIFGLPIINLATGQPVAEVQRYVRGKNAVVWLDGIPVFYLPYVQGDAEHPLGPLDTAGIGYNHIFGFQFYTTWNMYDLVGIKALPNTKWQLNLDVMTTRGPALGQIFNFAGHEPFGIPGSYSGKIQAYGIYDNGADIIGGNRGQSVLVSELPPFQPVVGPTTNVPVTHPLWRGRFFEQSNVQDLPYGFSVQQQLSVLSDHNFLEQYYAREFQNDLDQKTYLYVKEQEGNLAWTGLVEPRIRNWVTETEWLPRFDAYAGGLSIFDIATYNARASAAYAHLSPTDAPPPPFRITDLGTTTGRFDLFQNLSVPFALGPVKLVPYVNFDATYYTSDLEGQSTGRLYEAGGLRASMPLSRLYPDVCSELLNLNGIYHKIVLSANAYVAHSDVPFTRLPQLDRLNDDASDQAIRDIHPWLPQFYPGPLGTFLATSPLFDPQAYAVRKLVLDQIDTLDSVEVLELDARQRWQTKRGFPGREHIVDWMTLDLSASIFPRSDRDNFGRALAFLQYNWLWNIGDRTSLESTGWVDPIENGPRVFTFGANLNRPDNTVFYVGYRQIDPLNSKVVIGSASYQFSQKYSITASATYDFGIKNQTNTVLLTRTGSDLRISFGFTYNSILNNFGVVFEILPNLFPTQIHSPMSPSMLGSR
jgi:hypothetical protein